MSNICRRFGVELVLIAFAVVMATGFLVTYVLAVSNNHVYPYFPYISDTGADAPESCVFTLVCSIGGVLVLFVVLIRFKYIRSHYVRGDYGDSVEGINCMNNFGILLGALTVLGLLIVGSFQDDKVLTVHFAGAFMVFGFGVLYEWVQLYVSVKIFRALSWSDRHVGKCILLFRFVLSAVGTVCFIVTVAIAPFVKGTDPKHWTKDDKDYGVHLFSTICEWIMAISFLLYFLTFHPNFTVISVDFKVRPRIDDAETNDERTPLNV